MARLLGEKLGMKVYNRELLEDIAKQFDMTIEHMEEVKAQRVNWWSDFCRFYQQFGAAGHKVSAKPDVTPLSLYYAEARALRELAEKESCIIVGRAGFHIFRDNSDAIHLFIRADRQSRIARVAAQLDLDLDEAEKTFEKKGEVLLKMIDGVYNERRKLYLLTTNNLYLDPNLLGRPGRIRYIKQFGNLAPNAINEYIKDNLVDKSKADAVLKAVDTLEISTIDILKSIIDEVNIHGDITEHSMLNIPKARYKIDVVRFHYLGKEKFGELKEFLKSKMPVGMTMKAWLNKEWRVNEDNERETNEEMIEEMFNMSCWTNQLASSTQYIVKGQQTFYGEVIEEVDENGFFVVHDNSTDEEELCRVLNYHNAPSLYRGALSSFIY